MAAVSLDERVKILGADEALDLAERPDDLSALDGISGRGHDGSLAVPTCFLE